MEVPSSGTHLVALVYKLCLTAYIAMHGNGNYINNQRLLHKIMKEMSTPGLSYVHNSRVLAMYAMNCNIVLLDIYGGFCS